MAGDYYNSSLENPANRAKVSPSIFSQILDALTSLGRDTASTIAGKKWQDRGSAEPWSTDVLHLNAQSTPPAAGSVIPENPELRNGHQYNEPQFRFINIGTHHTLSNKPVATNFRTTPQNYRPGIKGPIFDWRKVNEAFSSKISGKTVETAGDKILKLQQTNQQPDGFESNPNSPVGSVGASPSSQISRGGQTSRFNFRVDRRA